jgi:quinoprotein glucose dehydrogenase
MATPMTYVWHGKQYVVIYAGGNARSGTALSDQVIAFALPETDQRIRKLP